MAILYTVALQRCSVATLHVLSCSCITKWSHALFLLTSVRVVLYRTQFAMAAFYVSLGGLCGTEAAISCAPAHPKLLACLLVTCYVTCSQSSRCSELFELADVNL